MAIKLMKHPILLLISMFLIGYSAQGQSDGPMVEKEWKNILSQAKKFKNERIISDYFDNASENQKSDTTFRASYYKAKLEYFTSVAIKRLKQLPKASILQDSAFLQFTQDAESYILLCPKCILHTDFGLFNVFEYLKIASVFPSEKRRFLETAGIKYSTTGPAIGYNYTYSGRHWAGLRFSVFSMYTPGFKLRYLEESYKSKGFMAHFLEFGYNFGFQNKNQQFLISLLHTQEPVFVKFFQLGLEKGKSENSAWFYRPELGIGLRGFYFSGGYQFIFNKNHRDLVDKWFLSIGGCVVLGKSEYPD